MRYLGGGVGHRATWQDVKYSELNTLRTCALMALEADSSESADSQRDAQSVDDPPSPRELPDDPPSPRELPSDPPSPRGPLPSERDVRAAARRIRERRKRRDRVVDDDEGLLEGLANEDAVDEDEDTDEDTSDEGTADEDEEDEIEEDVVEADDSKTKRTRRTRRTRTSMSTMRRASSSMRTQMATMRSKTTITIPTSSSRLRGSRPCRLAGKAHSTTRLRTGQLRELIFIVFQRIYVMLRSAAYIGGV